MAAGRGGGCCFPAGLLLLLLLLPPWALLSSLPTSAPDKSVTHRYENVKLLEITVHPGPEEETASQESSSLSAQKPPDEVSSEKEEETLNSLVNLLQDVVKNIPTDIVPTTVHPPTVEVPNGASSPSVSVDTVWVNVEPHQGEPRTIAFTTEMMPTTTPFWKLRSDETAAVVLHSESTSEEATTLEGPKTETSESVVLLSEDSTGAETTAAASVSVMETEEETTTVGEEIKDFDQLTNGALESLVESLKNVKKLHMTLDTFNHHPALNLPPEKSGAVNILEAIDSLIETVRNAPAGVRDDPSLHEYIGEAEGYLKNALELAGEAERKLLMRKGLSQNFATSTAPPETEMHLNVELPAVLGQEPGEAVKLDVELPQGLSSAAPATEVKLEVEESVSPTEEGILETSPAFQLLQEKAEETLREMGKLRGFINLLYGFSPRLTEFAEHLPNGKVAEDIIEKVIEAIKSAFCGNADRQGKQILKLLLQKDMALVRKAMKERRAS